nr:unnamed protein product [Callosobruchus chinensis]
MESSKYNAISFECCKTKELLNYICVTCSTRKKDLIFLGKHRIYCGKKCAQKAEESEEELNTLRQCLAESLKENEDKSRYIEKLRRKSNAFEDDVIEIENSYREEININQTIINSLNDRIDDKDKQNKPLMEEIERLKGDKKSLQNEISVLQKKLATSMNQRDLSNKQNNRTLVDNKKSNENKDISTSNHHDTRLVANHSTTAEDLETIRAEESRVQGGLKDDDQTPSMDKPTGRKNNLSKILIYGDEYARSFRQALNLCFDKSFDTEAKLYPHIDFSCIAKNLFQDTIQYGKEDFVIVMVVLADIDIFDHWAFFIFILLTTCSQSQVRMTRGPDRPLIKALKHTPSYCLSIASLITGDGSDNVNFCDRQLLRT